MRWLNGEGRFGNFGLGLLVLGRVLGHVFISSPSAKADASKVSDRPVPVLKVTFSGEASGT